MTMYNMININYYLYVYNHLYEVSSKLFFPVVHWGVHPVVVFSQDMKRKSSFSLLDQTTKRPMPGSVLWLRLHRHVS